MLRLRLSSEWIMETNLLKYNERIIYKNIKFMKNPWEFVPSLLFFLKYRLPFPILVKRCHFLIFGAMCSSRIYHWFPIKQWNFNFQIFNPPPQKKNNTQNLEMRAEGDKLNFIFQDGKKFRYLSLSKWFKFPEVKVYWLLMHKLFFGR